MATSPWLPLSSSSEDRSGLHSLEAELEKGS